MQRYGPACISPRPNPRVYSGEQPGARSCWSPAQWPRYRRQSAVDDRSHEVGLIGYCHQYLLEKTFDFVNATFGSTYFLFIICCSYYQLSTDVNRRFLPSILNSVIGNCVIYGFLFIIALLL